MASAPSHDYGYIHVVQATNGDALVLEYDNKGKSGFILIDGGPSRTYERPTGGKRSTTANLFHLLDDLSNRRGPRNLESIDTVVVTHDDEDHKNGIADLFRFLLRKDNRMATPTQWRVGLGLMNEAQSPPIEKIWYNSQKNLMDALLSKLTPDQQTEFIRKNGLKNGVDKRGTTPGWFDAHLAEYNGDLGTKIKFNEEFKSGLLVTSKQRPTCQRGKFTIKILGPDQATMDAKLAAELINTSLTEEERTDKNATGGRHGGSGSSSAMKKATSDYSAKNRSSIAFLAEDGRPHDAKARILFLGDAKWEPTDDDKRYDYTIMKVAHHGSGHNSFERDEAASEYKYAKIKASSRSSLLAKSMAFFSLARAKKFIISASPTEGSPNPAFATVLGIYLAAVEKRINVEEEHKRKPWNGKLDPKMWKCDVYMTNNLPENTKKSFTNFLRSPLSKAGRDQECLLDPKIDKIHVGYLEDFDAHMTIWVLKPGALYGSISIYGDSKADSQHWTEIKKGFFVK